MFHWFSIKVPKQFNGKKDSLFNKQCWSNWLAMRKKINLILNVRAKIMDFNKKQEKILVHCVGQKIYRYNLKSKIHKWKKVDKLDFIKIENYFTSKDTIKKVKKITHKELKEIFTNHIFDKGFLSRLYKNSHRSIVRRQTLKVKINGQFE